MVKKKINRQYRISLIFTGCIMVAGFLLQLIAGSFNIQVLEFPVNMIFAVIIVLTAIGLSLYNKTSFFRWFSGIPFSVTLSAALAALCLVMGLVPQMDGTAHPATDGFLYRTGIFNVTSSWPFVLVYLLMLLNLACVMIRRSLTFRLKDYGFYLNHAGLWILLLAAGPGSADTGTYNIKIEQGASSDTGVAKDNTTVRLPFRIHLDEFTVDEYPPKLIVVDDSFSKMLPEKKPANMQAGETGTKGKLLDWEIEIEEYLPRAVRGAEGGFRPIDMPGSSEAASIKATGTRSGETVRGWLYRGNSFQEPQYLRLGRDGWLVMNEPEPKQFISAIRLTVPGEEDVKADIEVNKPLKYGDWMLYQSGYDRVAGRHSSYTVLTAVYDPWLDTAYAGILLLAGGALSMLWRGRKKKDKL